MAPTLAQAIEVAARKAFVILDGTLLRIDRVAMGSGLTRDTSRGGPSALGSGLLVLGSGAVVWSLRIGWRR